MSFDYITPAISKWKLNDFMNIINDFENDFIDDMNHKISAQQDYKTILLYIVGKSLVTAREILTLCAHGYPDGALSLGRNLYEQMMIIAFLDINKKDANLQSYVDDFFLSYEVQKNKCLRDTHQYIPEDIDTLNTEWEMLKNRAHREINGDYWWTGHRTFSHLTKYVMQHQNEDVFRNFLGIHYARYKRACISLHAGCMGNMNRLGNNSNAYIINTSPSVYGQSSPLIFAAVSLIAIIGTVCSAFGISNAPHLNSLNELLIFYQEQEKDDFSD